MTTKDASNCDNTWRLMTEYHFQVDPDSISDNMSCFLCKNLMVDACRSVCGCQYCHKCICDYIRDKDKFCPGNKTKCKLRCLSLEKDVMRDKSMNNMIFQAKVLCPNESCQSKCELRQMEEHLRICGKQFVECPYAILGCDNVDQKNDSILSHINNEALPHTQLLLEYIHNLKNEVDGLKLNSEKSQLEILSLQQDARMKDAQTTETMEEVNSHRRAMYTKITNIQKELNAEKQHSKNEIDLLKVKLEESNGKIHSLVEDLNWKNLKIAEMKEEMTSLKHGTNEEIRILKKEMEFVKENSKKQMSEFVQQMENEKEKSNEDATNLKTEMESVKAECAQKENIIATLERRLSAACSNIDADFIWKIHGWTKKKKENYSEPFYSKNYKFCLRQRPIGNDIWLECVIMKGDNNNTVQWPMKHGVTLSIINQYTLKAHKSVMLKYETYEVNKKAFDRPTNDMNYFGIGTSELIKYSSMKDNPSIFANESFVVSCTLTDP